MIAWPEPNNKYIMHPNASIIAINKKTTGQLCVTCKMCPEKYTPRKPEKKKENISCSCDYLYLLYTRYRANSIHQTEYAAGMLWCEI